MKGYVLDVYCADCGKQIWNDFLTLRFPLRYYDSTEIIDLLCCYNCDSPQYIVKYDEQHDVEVDDLEYVKENYDINAHFSREDVEKIDTLEYAEIYVSSEKISEQEVERRKLLRQLKALENEIFSNYYEPPFGSDDELGPKTITANVMEILDEGYCEVDFGVEGETLLEELVEEMDEYREAYLLEYVDEPPHQRYFVVSQRSYYTEHPRYVVLEFSKILSSVDTYVARDKDKLLAYLKECRHLNIVNKKVQNVVQLPWNDSNIEMLKSFLREQ